MGLQQSKILEISVDLTKWMSFYYEIPLMSFNRQCFLAVPWQRDCNTKWEFHTAKNATFEDSHLICQLTLLKLQISLCQTFECTFVLYHLCWNCFKMGSLYFLIWYFVCLFVFIYAGRLALSFGYYAILQQQMSDRNVMLIQGCFFSHNQETF